MSSDLERVTMARTISVPENGCSRKHLRLTLGWVAILLGVCGSLLAWTYSAVQENRSDIERNIEAMRRNADITREQVIRNEERLTNIDRNTQEIKRMLERKERP
jgi:HAMP domain-containing protein